MAWLDNIEQIVAAYPLLAFGAVFLAGVLSSASPDSGSPLDRGNSTFILAIDPGQREKRKTNLSEST